jgi:hypothetical protein
MYELHHYDIKRLTGSRENGVRGIRAADDHDQVDNAARGIRVALSEIQYKSLAGFCR